MTRRRLVRVLATARPPRRTESRPRDHRPAHSRAYLRRDRRFEAHVPSSALISRSRCSARERHRSSSSIRSTSWTVKSSTARIRRPPQEGRHRQDARLPRCDSTARTAGGAVRRHPVPGPRAAVSAGIEALSADPMAVEGLERRVAEVVEGWLGKGRAEGERRRFRRTCAVKVSKWSPIHHR